MPGAGGDTAAGDDLGLACELPGRLEGFEKARFGSSRYREAARVMARSEESRAAIGFRARTGRAVAVVLAGASGSPRAVVRTEVTLTSPVMPATFQPYHEVMDLPWKRARTGARKAESVIESVATEAIRRLVRDTRSSGLEVTGLGVVGSPDRDLEAIGNPHIRAHAAEGILFRHVLEVAAERNGLESISFAEGELDARAASQLSLSPATVKSRIAEFGRTLGRPWRADERAAATSAWLALAAHRRK